MKEFETELIAEPELVINKITKQKLANALGIIEQRINQGLPVFFTIEAKYSNLESKWTKIAHKNPDGISGFQEALQTLQSQRPASIKVLVHSRGDGYAGNPIFDSGASQFALPEIQQRLGNTGIMPNHDQIFDLEAEVDRRVDHRLASKIEAMEVQFAHREEMLSLNFQIKELELLLSNKDSKIAELEAKLKIAETTIEEADAKVEEYEAKISELEQFLKQYKEAGLGSLTDMKLPELLSTALNTGASVAGHRIAREVISMFSNKTPNVQNEQKAIEATKMEDPEYTET